MELACPELVEEVEADLCALGVNPAHRGCGDHQFAIGTFLFE